jgi:NAD(P)-dependent dehydrogenase (short-subunit alcohol dehydrogenase family)
MPEAAHDSPVIVLTGATGNLGRATAGLLTQRGMHLIAIGHETDLTDAAACEQAIAHAVERFGRIDGLVNTVGGFASAGVSESDPAFWDRMYRVNVLTTLNLFRAAISRMRPQRRGSLVAISAGAALRAPAGLAAYSAAKSAVIRMVESFADEVKGDGLRVNAILPGTIDTPPNRAAMPAADHAAWVTPLEIAEVIAFLLSDAASGITGAALPVTGRS